MIALAGGKPIALAEVGGLPSLDVLDRQPRWTYFMAWSAVIDSSNTQKQINEVYHGPRALNRDDPRLAEPMAAIRDATAKRTGGAAEGDPVTPGATSEAKALLTRLLAAPGQAVLSGQENDSSSPAAATAAVTAETGKQPAIYAAELAGSAEERQAVVKEALKAHAGHAEVSLSWHPARPTDGAPASAHGQLTSYEWNDLLTPGSALNKQWGEEVDAAAATLKEFQKEGIAVLWNPLPEANGKDFWWAGRKGVRGSAELYRQLFDRLVNHDGLKNLVWVWESDPPDFRGDGADRPSDFFPGLLYADAIELRLSWLDARFPAGMVAQGAVGKPSNCRALFRRRRRSRITPLLRGSWPLRRQTRPRGPMPGASSWATRMWQRWLRRNEGWTSLLHCSMQSEGYGPQPGKLHERILEILNRSSRREETRIAQGETLGERSVVRSPPQRGGARRRIG
jgi:hypothetical protein